MTVYLRPLARHASHVMSISPALPDAGLPKRAMHALLLVERSCAQCSPLGVLDVPLCVVAIEHSERNVRSDGWQIGGPQA